MGQLPPALDGVTVGGLPTWAHELSLQQPAWLFLLLAAPALWIVGRRSLSDFSPGQLRLQTFLRVLVLGGVALALAQPSLRRQVTDISAAVLVDVSASVGEPGMAAQRKLIAELQAAAPRGRLVRPRPLRIVRFAASAAEWGSPGADPPGLQRFGAPVDHDTNIAAALALAGGLIDPTAIPRMLLVSDGEGTAGDVLSAAQQLAARGIPIDVMPLSRLLGAGDPTAAGDVAIERLEAPEQIRPRAPFDLRVSVVAEHAGPVRLRLERDGRPNLPDAERTVDVTPGLTVVDWPARIDDAGVSVFRARIIHANANRHLENDQGIIAIATTPEPRVLVWDSQPEAAAGFVRALQAEKITVDVQGPRTGISRAALERYDLLVISDLPRAHLDDAAMQAVESFVQNGGGLLMAGGPGSFGSGGYAETRLGALLPVRLDLPEKQDEATLALALVIDRSGSMSGPKMDLTKEAARATAEMMPPSDQIAVIAFDNQAIPVVRLQQAANRLRILSDISRIQASGGTNILAGLREAVDELLPARARKKHVILLSDGQSAYDGIADLVEGAISAQITFSAVGVGDGADQTLLQMIASRGGGRFYHTRDPASIPRIFSRETSQIGRRSIVEEPTSVRTGKHAEALAGLAFDTAPKLRGYTVTRPRPDTDLLLTTGDGAPLLARWQVGLGQVAAWTSDIKPRWSADWARWAAYPKFWAQVVRSTMRRRATTHLPLAATLDADTVNVVLDAVDANDQFLTGLQGSLEVIAARGDGGLGERPPRRISLGETAPGRYEAAVRLDPPVSGALLLRASLMRGTVPVADASGRLAVPFGREWRPHPPAPTSTPGTVATSGEALLAAIAARTGGRILTEPAQLYAPGRDQRSAEIPLRTPLLLVTMGLFLIDVLLRRVRLVRRASNGH